jgi:long-chain acyl-CoA synthetase
MVARPEPALAELSFFVMAGHTIPHRLLAQAKARPHGPAYHRKVDGRYHPTSWADYAKAVRRAGKALLALGFEPGSTIAILGYNRPEWVILDVAAMAVGGAPTGIYTTCSPDEVRYIIDHAESPVALVENAAQWAKVQAELERIPRLRHVVMMAGAPRVDHPILLAWDEFLAKGDGVADARFDERMAALEPDGLATLIYTSGTTGPPKGVMLSHQNLAWTGNTAADLVSARTADVVLSYLPLSHIAEQVFSIYAHVTAGYEVYFAQSIETVPEDLKQVKPTVFFGVPRIWEKLHVGIADKLAEAPPARRAIAAAAMRVGHAYRAARNEGHAPGVLLSVAHAVADRVFFSKVKGAIGFGRTRHCISGAAPIAPSLLDFFMSLDLPLYEVYGQSEDTGPTSITLPGKNKIGTVGPPIPGVEVRFGDDGEILVRGPNVFLGYFKDPEATAETIVNGWLRSGDLGKFDEAGNLVITGRKKEIIITAGGKNITPKNIEAALKEHALIAEAVVVGDRRKYLTALLILAPGEAAKLPPGGGEVRIELQRIVDEVNGRFARVETVKRFHVLPRPFSIEAGELTPTLKVKRRVVYERYAREIDAMYEGA